MNRLKFFKVAFLVMTFSLSSFAAQTKAEAGKTKKESSGGYATDSAGRKINWDKIKCKLDPHCKWIDATF